MKLLISLQIVNISQSPYLFDESLQVLKFSAIASKVTVETFPDPEPETPQTVKKRPPKRTTEIDRLATNKTRFSILMEKKLAGKSLLDGRDSIAWENPALSSTQKVNKNFEGIKSFETLQSITLLTYLIINQNLTFIDKKYIVGPWR